MIERYRLKGMKLRDEFICPITYELLLDPAVASDGHSYEQKAIDKWLQQHNTSPKNGSEMSKVVIPNTNLRKLIQSLISEGGRGLYEPDPMDSQREIEVCKYKVLIMKCLGPPESEWHMQCFQVGPQGCIGGRQPDQQSSKELVLFRDMAISRTHFQIAYHEDKSAYFLRDLGSVGGTFVHLMFGQQKVLAENDMILIGRHQFLVSFTSVTPVVTRGSKAADELMSLLQQGPLAESKSGAQMEATELLAECLIDATYQPRTSGLAESKTSGPPGRICVFSCFAPEGSPIVGKRYTFNCCGGSIGRKPSNKISLSALVDHTEDAKEEEQTWEYNGRRLVSVDPAVSGVHAHVRYDEATGVYTLHDGPPVSSTAVSKASTNGTWFRLSTVHQVSDWVEVRPYMEFLMGTVRFASSESVTISETLIPPPDEV